MLTISRLASALVITVGALSAANAAEQCFAFRAGATTTYGAVDVTVSGNCVDTTVQRGTFAAGTAQLMGGSSACTYTFSKPLLTNSVSIQVEGLQNNGLSMKVRIDDELYQSTAADIGPPLVGSTSTSSLQILDTGYIGVQSPSSSGTIKLTNNPPATLTSLRVAKNGQPSWIKVCADDAGVPAPVTASTPVPTLSEWNLVLTSGLLAAVGFFAFVRKKRAGRPVA